MSIEIEAVYRKGALHPDRPLGIPEGSKVKLVAPGIEEESDLEAIRASLEDYYRGEPGIPLEEFLKLLHQDSPPLADEA